MSEPRIEFAELDLGARDTGTALCAIVDAGGGRIVASVNARFPDAADHVRAHVARGFETVLMCGPDCDGIPR
jgi:hypothetical protein